MKSKIGLSLVPLIAAVLMGGCDETPEQVNRVCLDQDQNVVDAQACQNMYDRNGQVDGHPYWYYYWYYTNNGYRPAIGSRAVVVPGRGSFSAPEGASFGRGATVGSVSRGGFGSSASGAAGE